MLNSTKGFGTRSQWSRIGRAFASYLMPGGQWAKANNAPSHFGITDYSAINEPDDGTGFVSGGLPGPIAYAEALAGLSEGVQTAVAKNGAVDPQLRTMPGGFMSANAFGDCTLRGLAPTLGQLWRNGTLAAIDLHTYFDIQYAPMEKTFRHSSQANFDCVLKAAGLPLVGSTVKFVTTEFNFKKRAVSEEDAARGMFTAIVDQLSVVDGNNTPISLRFFP